MKTIPCEQGLAAAMLWLASRLTVWGTRLECVAQQRAAACENSLAASRLDVYQARRAEWQAGQPLR